MISTSEEVLDAWLKLSTAICNERIVPDMPYNETLICRILYRNQQTSPEKRLTATDLCNETHMLKSLMNRTLNSMEEKGLIQRIRSQKDRRQVYVTMNMEQAGIYEQQHKKILDFVDTLLDKLGREKADQIIQLFTLISTTADEVLR